MAKKQFAPYQNEADYLQLGELTIENRLDRISIFGTIDLWKDKSGLKAAKELKNIIDQAVAELEKSALPDKIELAATDTVPCPF